MAEKEFKRKSRIKTGTGTTAPGLAAGVHVSQNATTGQRDLGAPYHAGPAFGLGDHNLDESEQNAVNNSALEEKQSGGYQHADWLLNNTDHGIAIPLKQRQRLQRRFGRDFSGVRLHIGPAADQSTRSLSSLAFTRGDHIWLSNRVNPSDDRILSHELTHVVQQGHAAPLQARSAISLSSPNAPIPVARQGAPAATAQSTAPPTGGAVQRFSIWGAAKRIGRAVSSGISTAAGFVSDVAGNLLSMGRSALMAIVRRVAPSFATIFERDGIRGFLRRLIQRGLRSLFDGLTAPMRAIFNFGNIGARFNQAISWITTIAGQLANNDCSGILAAASKVKAFFSRTFGPFVDKIKAIADKVKGFFSSIWEAIGGPIMDILKRIGGAIWRSLQTFVSNVASVIRTVRNALGSAWRRVKSWFDIGAEDGESEGGGLWNWIKDKATSIGRSVSNAVKPIIGPLRDVGGVMLMLVPGGQIAGVMLLWPRLKQAFNWISQKWRDLNLIPRARAFLANTVIPTLMNAAEWVAQAFIGGADWLLGLLDRVAGYLASALRAATGWFAPLGRVIRFARNQFHRFVVWARGGLRYVSRNFRSLVRRLIEFLQPILDALRQLALVLVNPFGIVGFLAGTVWRMVPECLKGPLIDFILDIIIGFLRMMPPLPMLGLLWPLIKQAMLGFFERVRSFTTERKVNVSNKIARIISGMSPDFIIGYFKGMVIGLWEGITAPFMAIAAIFELPGQIREFLNSMGLRLCELVEQISCFASELAGRVFGTLDEVLNALGELLQDPARLIELIRCAIEGAMAAVRTIGASIADQMMSLFESAEAEIGERLGKIVGSTLVQVVITYFTAGAGAGVAVINRLSGALRMIGRALRHVLKIVRKLLGKLVSFIRGFGQRIARGARGVMARMGRFFRRVAAWFKKLFRRIARRFRGRSPGARAKRRQWKQFKRQTKQMARGYRAQGVPKEALKNAYRRIARNYRKGVLVTFITKSGPYWRLWAAPRFFPFRPRRISKALLDRNKRWRAGKKAILKAIRKYKRLPGNIDSRGIQRTLRRVGRQYRYKGPAQVRFEQNKNIFRISWSMSPPGPIASIAPELDGYNEFSAPSPGQKAVVDNLVYEKGRRSSPVGDPTYWNDVNPIKAAPKHRVSAYIKGHLISGFFAPGDTRNLTPISRASNANMAVQWEVPIRRELPKSSSVLGKIRAGKIKELNVYKHTVSAEGEAGGTPPIREVMNQSGVPQRINRESDLARTIKMTITKKKYNEGQKRWTEDTGAPLGLGTVKKSDSVKNVPNMGKNPTTNGFPPGKIKP